MKYQTLAELKEAYDNGELDRSNPLWLDNDDTFVYDDINDEDGEQVFNGGMPDRDLLAEALELLEIPYEWV